MMNDTKNPNAADITLRLAAWWETAARDLPWRFGRASDWGVLVSEVMSQQTQMSRVVPYWTAWMERWPDARALAGAPKAEVITAWGRLGYPRRALRLQECARTVAEQYDNQLPHTYDELLALPGVGDYTASAVMSFAFGERIAVIDTNIRRVISRVFRGEESFGGAASPVERETARRLLPENDRASVTWNQSVMELGATVCTAKAPLCDRCPIAGQWCSCVMAGQAWGSGVPGRANGSRVRIARCVGWCSTRCANCRRTRYWNASRRNGYGRTVSSLTRALPRWMMTVLSRCFPTARYACLSR